MASPDAEAGAGDGSQYEQQLERRRGFSAWLSRSAAPAIEQEVGRSQKGGHVEAIFSYLTGKRVSEACRLAQESGEGGGGWVRMKRIRI